MTIKDILFRRALREATPTPGAPAQGFRGRLLIAMMVVVTVVTLVAVFFAQRNVAANARREFEREFQAALTSFHSVQAIRHAVLAERCRTLARRPRILAALEDNALDLLYPSAQDELADVLIGGPGPAGGADTRLIRARFYRFLDANGALIAPPDSSAVGWLDPEEEKRLALPAVPDVVQLGYVERTAAGGLDEVIVVPIFSSESGRPQAALVLGSTPHDLATTFTTHGMKSGVWTEGRLHLPGVAAEAREEIAAQLTGERARGDAGKNSFTVELGGESFQVFYLLLNPGSMLPRAYEVCVYPLAESQARQRWLGWQVVFAGGGLLLGALVASHFLAKRLSVPVEQLEVSSKANEHRRLHAEAELALRQEELRRAARFSADASHQLKTPVTVLRAGLEELLTGEQLPNHLREEVADLVHQTFRLTSVIDDLLLLSRMDAGRLQLEIAPLNLIPLIEGWMDDLAALPDTKALEVESEYPPDLLVEGERRYTTMILQNLLENARKYNRPGGVLRITLRAEGAWAILRIGNSGATIPPAMQEHIFQRFYRGGVGENLPGYGLGLNLAKELVRLHRGELRLVSSADDWTEFEVKFRLAGGVG